MAGAKEGAVTSAKVQKLFRVLVLAGVGLAETVACSGTSGKKGSTNADGGSTSSSSSAGGVHGW